MITNKKHWKNRWDSLTVKQSAREALEKSVGFTYRQAIGKLIYALVTCRPDISYACIKLSQYSAAPAAIHYEAVKQIYRYLHATVDRGIYYWRHSPHPDLPYQPHPTPYDDVNYDSQHSPERLIPCDRTLTAAVDSDYAGDQQHRKSVTGVCVMLAGGTVLYKTQFQSTIALSTTEAEFTAACEAGKYILYLRTIMDEIGLDQNAATTLYEDNQGALLMGNAQRPTKRTRHMDVKHFALQQWIEQDLITMKRINTHDNHSDVLTKATGRILFYRHNDYLMGYHVPQYANHLIASTRSPET